MHRRQSRPVGAAGPWVWPAAALAVICACGNQPDSARPATPAAPAAAPSASSASSASSAPPVAPAGPEIVGDNPAKPRVRQPFPIHSSCASTVTIVFGEDPKAPGAGRRTLPTNSSTDGPRDADGKQTVSLLDDNGEPIAKVHINRGMKQLEIGRSCRTLDAH